MVASGEWLARKLLELEQQVQALSRGTRLGNSSLQGESILALDEDGEVLAELGTDGGAGGVLHLDGPVPPRPTAPVLEQGVGTIFVRWGGAWHPLDDEDEQPTTPLDFDRIEVHATTDPEATEWDEDTLVGSITQRTGGVVMIRGWDIDDVVYVRLVCRSLADKLSEPSEPAEVTVTGIDVAAIVDELDAANVELSNLDGTMFAVGAELDALAITFKNLDTSIINTDDGTLADALDDARQALEDARTEAKDYTDSAASDLSTEIEAARAEIEGDLEVVRQSADGKSKITWSTSAPSGVGKSGDTWFRMSGNNIIGHWRHSGSAWVSMSLDATVIPNLDAGKINSGTIDAERIGAGSITADKLLIGGAGNLLPGADDLATSSAGWSAFGHNANHPSVWLKGTQEVRTDAPFALRSGTTYKASVDVQASVPGTTFYWQVVNVDNAAINQYVFVREAPGTSWTSHVAEFTVPATGNYRLRVYSNHRTGAPNPDGWQWFRAPRIVSMTGATLIENGAITTGKIAADAITTGKISANAIGARAIAADAVEAGKIAADSISGREIIANTIKAEHIAAFTITAGELAANSVSTDKLVANSVIADKLAANSVIAEKIDALAVTADKLAANAVTADKIAANAITAGKIEAGAVTGEVMSADALNFKRAVGLELSAPSIKLGDAVEITEEHGIRQFGPDGALNVDLPSDGSPASVRGDFSARRLSAQQMQLTGATTIASGADMVIESGVTAPTAAPQVTPYWGRITMPPLTDREQAAGLAWGEGHWWRLVTTSVSYADGGRTRIEKITPSGALVDTITGEYRTKANGITYLNGELYVLAAALSVSGDGTTPTRPRMVVVYGTDGVERRRWEYEYYGSGTYEPGIGTNGTDIVTGQCLASSGELRVRRFSPTGALLGTTDTGRPVAAGIDGVYLGPADFGSQKLVIAKRLGGEENLKQFAVYDQPRYSYNGDLSWYTPNRGAPAALAYDGTHFWSMTSEGNLVRYSRREGSRVVGDDSANWWLAASWRNNPAESLAGPAQRFTWPHRSELLVTVPDIPQGVTGVAFFAARQTSEPVRTDLHWVAEINEAARTVIIPSMSGTWSSDRAPVSVSSFTDQQPGELRSALGNFRVDGLGAGAWGPLTFGADGSLRGAGTVITGEVSHPSIAAGNLNSHDVTVTFPAGRFASPPVIMLSHTNGLVAPVPSSGTVTKDSFQLRVWNPHETRIAGAGTVYWAAIERST